MPPFPSAPSSPATNNPSKRRRRPPLIPLRQQIPLKTLPQASSDPSPATNNPQNVAAGLLLSLSSDKNPSKRRRSPPLIPLRRQKPLKTSPQAPSYPSPATNTPQNVAADLLLSLSGDENPSKRRRMPPLIPLRQQIPLKTLPQASSDPSPATNIPQIVAAGLLLSLSGDKKPSKRCRMPPLIPLRQRIPLKTSPQGAEGTAIRQRDIYFDFILNCFNLGVDG